MTVASRTLSITKKDGSSHEFDERKVVQTVARACRDLEQVDSQVIVEGASKQLFEGVSSKDIIKSLVISARSNIEREPEYQYAAARLLLGDIYKETLGKDLSDVASSYKTAFKHNLEQLVAVDILNADLLTFDLDKLADALEPSRDQLFKYLGLQTIYDRYLLKIDGHRHEAPQAFFMRVAMGLALAEDDREARAIEFYNVLSQFQVLSSTPTLFNSGTVHSQMSSCYLNTFDDSIDGIFDGLWQEARKSKFAGGLGMDMTPLRARGSFIKGTNGENQGAVFFWKLYNDLLVSVNQGGKRKGAGCAYLEPWHADIEDFLSLRKNTGDERMRTHDMNTANWLPDLFLEQVKRDGEWYLFSPNETPELHESFGKAFETHYWNYVEKGKRGELRVFKVINAKDLWKKMLRSIFETGHPWVTFKDPCNIRYTNQHEGVVHSSNLCTEITLHTKASSYDQGVKVAHGETAVCNLASLNLEAHVDPVLKTVDFEKLEKSITIAMRMLDNVIDLNFYPTKEAENSNLRHRPVGLGSMGWQNLFYALDVSYESAEAVKLSGELYEFISYHAISASSDLAAERGTYSSYEGSTWSQGKLPQDTYRDLCDVRDMTYDVQETLEWDNLRDKVKQQGMRNSNTMAIAPTATISYIAGTSQSIEPNFSVLFVYSTLSGEFTMINEFFVQDMKARGLWNPHMIDVVKHVDGDLSLLPDDVVPADLKAKYTTAFNLDQTRIIDCNAARQVWIDQAVSLNLYNNKTSLKFLNDIYMHAYERGLKTTYYLRTVAASKVEKSTVSANILESLPTSTGTN
ncbi:MAG: ribonucleoside-diphosphate reductase subunit alpha [Deinococcota bacterium]